MKNIAPGLSLKKYKGNKHEQGGIMVNALGNKTKDVTKAVAEVEGGEYNYRYNPNNPKDNYILSEQLGIANLAKQADKYKGNDRISYNTRNNLLNKSVKLNEILKAQQEQSQMQQAALGGMLKKYNPGGFLLKGSQSIVDSMVANSKQNDLTQVTTTPEIKLGKTTTPKLETKQAELPKLPVTTPKTTAEAANTGIQVNTKTNTTPEPTINKKGVKDVTSGLSGIASAFGPIGQVVGAGIQLAPYAIDLGKAMFDKTAVQDLQTQGSAMRLPNTKYAKHGGKLNVTPLPKFILGGDPNKLSKKENKKIQDRWNNLARNGNPDITEFEKLLGLSVSDKNIQSNPINNVSNRLNSFPVSTPGNEILYQPATVTTQPLKVKTKLDKALKKFFNTPKDYNPNVIIPQVTNSSLDFDTRVGAKNSSDFNKDNRERMKELDAKLKNPTITNTNTTNSVLETPQSDSSKLYKAGQNKQKLSEALMYGMAALPSEQIKTITPDYGRGDDAMSRMGVSTEPIRQEIMQGANKALELTRSQVGTAGQLQSRGQSIMSNVGSQLAQSQLQQQQYLNQLRGALAQREDTKANVLAQSELTAREAKSAERAAKLDQLNNAISQTSAIGAGTMEQASKMSTIENENERFARSQMQLMEIANMAGGLKAVIRDGKIVLEYDANSSGQSNIKAGDLSKQQPANTGTGTPPPSSTTSVAPVTTTGTTHTIKKGDTLYAIAKANNTTVSNLLKANGFANDKALLLPGKTIKIK